jgi:hypothetical protein
LIEPSGDALDLWPWRRPSWIRPSWCFCATCTSTFSNFARQSLSSLVSRQAGKQASNYLSDLSIYLSIFAAYCDTDSAFLSTVVAKPELGRGGMHLERIKHIMDFSNFDRSSPLYDNSRKGQLGLWKSELADLHLHSLVSMRAKVYALRHETRLPQTLDDDDDDSDDDNDPMPLAEKVALRGIKTTAARREERFQQLLDSLHSLQVLSVKQVMIQSKKFKTFSIEQHKRMACPGDDKRVLLCKFHSLPLGHPILEHVDAEDLVCTKCLVLLKQQRIWEQQQREHALAKQLEHDDDDDDMT